MKLTVHNSNDMQTPNAVILEDLPPSVDLETQLRENIRKSDSAGLLTALSKKEATAIFRMQGQFKYVVAWQKEKNSVSIYKITRSQGYQDIHDPKEMATLARAFTEQDIPILHRNIPLLMEGIAPLDADAVGILEQDLIRAIKPFKQPMRDTKIGPVQSGYDGKRPSGGKLPPR